MIQPIKKGKDFTFMIWAAFWATKKSNIFVLERDFES
jgi:hypothetical protein